MSRRLAIAAAVGLTGSVAIAASAIMVGRLPAGQDQWAARGPLAWVGRGSEEAANRWFVAGCLVLAVAWLAVVQTCRATRAPAWAPLVIAAIWCMPLFFAPPVGSGDVYGYTAYGRVSANGGDPYSVGGGSHLAGTPTGDSVDPFWATTPSPYGPAWIGISEVVARVADERPELAVAVFRAVALAAVVAAALAAVACARPAGLDPALVVAVFAGCPLVLVHLVGGAHNDAVVLALLSAGVAAAATNRFVLAIVMCTLAGAVKAPALVVLAVVAWRLGTRRLLQAFGLAVATFAAVTLLARVDLGWLENLDATFVVYSPLSVSSDVAIVLSRQLEPGEWLGNSATVDIVRTLGSATAAVVVAIASLLTRRVGLIALVAVTTFVVAALSPVVYPWYITWMLPFAALVAARAGSIPWVLAVVASLATTAVLPSGRSFVDPPVSSTATVAVVGGSVAVAVGAMARFLVSAQANESSTSRRARLRPRRSELR